MQREAKIASNKPAHLSEYDAITKTVQNYINGGKTGHTADMKLAFHPDATIFGYIGPDLFAGPIQGLFDWNDQ
ncbi:MAG: nuclear transport factor 2 family protein, partial [Acidobacteriota bacterium]|nr:nuclear transport factor 2 family protein [Acidobacteriota bacterium]